jgi:hypothetical protein
LRLLKDLSVVKPDEPTRQTPELVPVDQMTAEELAELDRLFEAMDVLRARVLQRIAVDGARSILEPPKSPAAPALIERPIAEVIAAPTEPEIELDENEFMVDDEIYERDPETGITRFVERLGDPEADQ